MDTKKEKKQDLLRLAPGVAGAPQATSTISNSATTTTSRSKDTPLKASTAEKKTLKKSKKQGDGKKKKNESLQLARLQANSPPIDRESSSSSSEAEDDDETPGAFHVGTSSTIAVGTTSSGMGDDGTITTSPTTVVELGTATTTVVEAELATDVNEEVRQELERLQNQVRKQQQQQQNQDENVVFAEAVQVEDPTNKRKRLFCIIGFGVLVLIVIIAVGIRAGLSKGGGDSNDNHDAPTEEVLGITQVGGDIEGANVGDYLGLFVAMSSDGNRIAVNVPTAAPGKFVRILDWTGTQWLDQEAEFSPTVDVNSDSVSGFKLSADGTRLLIRFYGDLDTSLVSQFVSVYDYANDGSKEWEQVGSSVFADFDDTLSRNMDISGDGNSFILGVHKASFVANTTLSIMRVYELSLSNEWTQVGSELSVVEARDFFDVAISYDGTRIIVGAAYKGRFSDSNEGQLLVYDWAGSDWQQLESVVEGDARDLLGTAVAITSDGGRIAGGGVGYVQVLDWKDGRWEQIGGKIKDVQDSFGASLAMSSDGNRIVIGGWQASQKTGYVRAYGLVDSEWKDIGDSIFGEMKGDAFGGRVDMSYDGTRFIVGGAGHRDSTGHVRVFEIA